MTAAAYISSALLIIGSVLWYRSNPDSAGYLGSFLVLMGALGLIGLLLCGCGESVSEYKQNEKRDEALRDIGADASSADERLQDLEARVSILERAVRHEETVK